MKPERMLEELEQLAGQLGISLRYERGDFEGGYCILREKRLILVNRRLEVKRKTIVLALALSEIGVDTVFVKPAVREFIEDEVAKNMHPVPGKRPADH